VTVRAIEQTWQRDAACRGPESALFFAPSVPEAKRARDAREARAKAICGSCRVRAACLDYALRIRDPHGIWGGLNEHERRALLEAQTV
jgi:WhiB family transcriptional regulator, redox-sensing transcriptional regulator